MVEITPPMPDQTPPAVSDAEVEALIGRFRHVADAPSSWVLAALSAAEEMLRRMQRDRQTAEARSAAGVAVIEAARCIRHWHDRGEGMVVSADHVRALWRALELYDATPSTLAALASLLAAARADGLREAAAACRRWKDFAAPGLNVPFDSGANRWVWYGRHQYAEQCEKDILALISGDAS